MSFNFPPLKISYVKSPHANGVLCKERIFLLSQRKDKKKKLVGLPSEDLRRSHRQISEVYLGKTLNLPECSALERNGGVRFLAGGAHFKVIFPNNDIYLICGVRLISSPPFQYYQGTTLARIIETEI